MAESFLGEIRIFAGSYAPDGWAICDGSQLNINDNQPLYSLIGVIYGGDGISTFALPDLRGRLAAGIGQGVGLTPRVLGGKFGTEVVALTEAQAPLHTHMINASLTAANAVTAGPNVTFATLTEPARFYNDSSKPGGSGLASFSPKAISATGGSAGGGAAVAHDNIMPSLALAYIISLQGFYPDFA